MTIKQKQAFMKVVKGSSITQAMKEVGYSDSTAKRTNKITRTQGWKELLETYLPDDKLLKAPSEALSATKWNDFTGDREPDHNIRLKAAEVGFKLKGRMNENNFLQQYNIGEMNLEFIDESSIK
jgi:hypothetical protein